MTAHWPATKSRECLQGEIEFARWLNEEMLPACRADRERREANPQPPRRAPRIDDPDYLDGDYSRVGSYRSTRWGR